MGDVLAAARRTPGAAEAISGYDKIIGLDLSDVSVDGSLHKSPAGGEGTGKNPTDRAKLGWKWSILTDANLEGVNLKGALMPDGSTHE